MTNFNFDANKLEYDSITYEEHDEELKIKMPSERHRLFFYFYFCEEATALIHLQ